MIHLSAVLINSQLTESQRILALLCHVPSQAVESLAFGLFQGPAQSIEVTLLSADMAE